MSLLVLLLCVLCFFVLKRRPLLLFPNSMTTIVMYAYLLCFVQYKSTTADRGAVSLTLVVYERILQTLLQRSVHDHVYNSYSQYRHVKHLIDVVTLFKEPFVGLVEGVT